MMRLTRWTFLPALMLAVIQPHALTAQILSAPPMRCTPMTDGTAEAWLARARAAVGVDAAAGQLLHLNAMSMASAMEQSDRPYAPYLVTAQEQERYLDPATGVEWLGRKDAARARVLTESGNYAVAGGTAVANAQMHFFRYQDRAYNPWAVLLDWSADSAVSVTHRCVYREYPRITLTRRGQFGEERLLLDEKTAMPVKLDRLEPHYLWGDARVEYIYATWWGVAPGVSFPVASTRMFEGEIDGTLSVFPGGGSLVPVDSGPSVPTLPPAPALPHMYEYAGELTLPDTVRVAENVFLLRTPFYTQTVALLNDTVFVLDATTGERRARADSVWIGRLFPGRHPITVVVTDLAWPHIAGVRFWVASGARIVSHEASRPFLERVIAQTWHSAPDKLERERARTRFDFVGVSDSLRLAGGALQLYPIDGVASENALLAYLPRPEFLWPGDYIQDGSAWQLYTEEVWRAVRRHGLTPARVAAQHLALTPWAQIEALMTRR